MSERIPCNLCGVILRSRPKAGVSKDGSKLRLRGPSPFETAARFASDLLRVTVLSSASVARVEFAMVKCLFAVILAALGTVVLDVVPAFAQSTRPPRPRVEVYPGRLSHRECVDGLQVSHKYPGRTVLMPYMRCWWVRR